MKKLVVITGTNASGKSGLGIELAREFGAEIISADSRQVYTGLDLGSGKVTPEEMKGVPHYLIDVAEPNEPFSLSRFQKMAYSSIEEITDRGNKAFLVGGTGLWVSSVVDGYNLQEEKQDPERRRVLEEKTVGELVEMLREVNPGALDRVDLRNKRRVERAIEQALSGNTEPLPNEPRYETLSLGVTWPREILYERIRERLDRRLEQGMIDEVVRLRENGAEDEFLYKLGLEYRYILMYLRGEFPDYQAFYDKLFMEIRHLAKTQMIWFRKRKEIIWLDMAADPMAQAAELIRRFYGE